MKKVSFLVMILSFVFMTHFSFASDNKGIIGTWKVTVSDAPYEYQNSSLLVSEVKGTLTAKIVFEDTREVKATNIQFNKDMLKFSVYLEGNEIQVTGKIENLKMTGTANTPEGDMKFSASKSK
jgi:hypothetical protein